MYSEITGIFNALEQFSLGVFPLITKFCLIENFHIVRGECFELVNSENLLRIVIVNCRRMERL